MTVTQDRNPTLSELDPVRGRVIAGNFRIEGLLGSGAMGNVYRAQQLSLAKPVAVKVLHPHLMHDEKLVARFKREAKSASLLNHPNSIQIIDSGQDADGTLYIAMELLQGRDLAQVIRDEFPLALTRVVRILSQVLSALEEAHAQGVIHRDLKPSNIMLITRRDERDFVKVCDFGIAKATLDDGNDDRTAMLTIQGLVCGTPEYMAPEQARGDELDARCDVYAMGVMLYELLTGSVPFTGNTPLNVLTAQLTQEVEKPRQRAPDRAITPALEAVVMHALAKDPRDRYATAAAFAVAIAQARSDANDVEAVKPERAIAGASGGVSMVRIASDDMVHAATIPSPDPATHASTDPRSGPSRTATSSRPPASREQSARITLDPPRELPKGVWVAMWAVVIVCAAGVGVWLAMRR
jgi:serine/threonine protein kinase